MLLPEPVQKLIDAFSRLPGIGPKTASRLAFFLLRTSDDLSLELAQSLQELKSSIVYCQRCFNITTAGRVECEICASPERDARLLCVVEEPLDVLALERASGFKGQYHVLGGVLSPIQGIGPDDLRIRELIERVRLGGIEEIILATNPNVEGEATAAYLARLLKPLGLKVTRIAMGVPVGSDLDFADEVTMSKSLENRREL